MHSTLVPLLGLGITTLAAPNPSLAASLTTTPFIYLPLNFTFHGGPVTYPMNFHADGQSYPTRSDLQVSLIDTNSFDAYSYCNFYGPNCGWITGIVQDGEQLAIGPPQVISSVACANWPGGGGSCLPEYSSCEWDSNQGGEFILPCCGFCAATKCRSFANPP